MVHKAVNYQAAVFPATFFNNVSSITNRFKLRLHGILERSCLEPFRIGTDGLPVCMMSWNRSVQIRSFQSIHALTVPNDSLSLSIHQEHGKFLKKFSHHAFFVRSLTQSFLREQIFQLSSAILSRIPPCLVSKRT